MEEIRAGFHLGFAGFSEISRKALKLLIPSFVRSAVPGRGKGRKNFSDFGWKRKTVQSEGRWTV